MRPESKIKVVFPLHGIRTQARWQSAFADVAQVAQWNCRLEKWNFGWFHIFQFISPWSRETKVRWFRETYYDEVNFRKLKFNENEYPSVVAHSFGTYILGNALLKYSYLRFNKVILCGCILPREFPWDKLIDRGQVQAVRNEFGVRDVWAKHVDWFIPQTGPSGTVGLTCKHQRFEQVEFRYDHSEYFDKGHMEAYWIPFLEKDLSFIASTESEVPHPRRTYPIVLCVILAILLAILLAGAVAGVRWLIAPASQVLEKAPVSIDRPGSQQMGIPTDTTECRCPDGGGVVCPAGHFAECTFRDGKCTGKCAVPSKSP